MESFAAEKLMGAFAPSFVSLSILVVEKDRDLCDTFEQVLTHDGHTVRVANSLEAACRDLERSTFDVMFLNINTVEVVPGHVLSVLTRHQGRPPEVVLVGEFIGRPDGALLHSYGATVSLATPFGSIELRSAVARAFGPRYLENMKNKRASNRSASEAVES
jgi:DNA-binding NtrC family response regulator